MKRLRDNRLRKVRYNNPVNTAIQIDNFNLKKSLGKLKNFTKDLSKGVANTVLAPVKAVGVVTGIKGAKEWGYNNPGDFSNEKRGKVFTKIQKVTDIAIPVAGLAVGGAAIAGGGSVKAGAAKIGGAIGGIFKKKGAKPNGIFKRKAITPQDEQLVNLTPDDTPPLLPIEEVTPIGNGIGREASGSRFVERVRNLGRQITPERIAKGKALLDAGRGKLSNAQLQFQKMRTDPSMLPKTRSLNEAEKTLLLPQGNETISMGSIGATPVLIFVGLGLLVLLGIFYKR